MKLTLKLPMLLWMAAMLLIASPVRSEMAVSLMRPEKPTVAIIIDDLGYRHLEGRRALALPGAVTLSILPHTPFGREFAEGAHAKGMEVMLHLPLQPE
ncbi:MAG: divergent polysaccharide deacetylase family protein, partial [Chromatiales bacterium]|nr:divergent polysaccharide deacetylase family protein [Chromatiales bacterium]